jgi:hypothetical protein
LLIALIFLIAFTAGFVAAHLDSGGSFKPLAIGILAVAALAIAGCGWMLVRQVRAPTGEEPLTRKERSNRNLLVVSGGLGGVIALALIFSQDSGVEAAGVFSSAPLPPWVALGLMLLIGVLLPIISLMWHRTVDEQEADAYKTGALYGFYVYAHRRAGVVAGVARRVRTGAERDHHLLGDGPNRGRRLDCKEIRLNRVAARSDIANPSWKWKAGHEEDLVGPAGSDRPGGAGLLAGERSRQCGS